MGWTDDKTGRAGCHKWVCRTIAAKMGSGRCQNGKTIADIGQGRCHKTDVLGAKNGPHSFQNGHGRCQNGEDTCKCQNRQARALMVEQVPNRAGEAPKLTG